MAFMVSESVGPAGRREILIDVIRGGGRNALTPGYCRLTATR